MRPRLPFTLIFNYKKSTHHKERGEPSPKEKKIQRNERKTWFKRETKGWTRGEFAEINWELSPSYYSLVFLFSIYSQRCVLWLKPCSLFFFYKSWTKFICGWVINNLDGLLTEYMCRCIFTVAFCFDSIYFYSLFRLITHLMILAKKGPQKTYLSGTYQSDTWS